MKLSEDDVKPKFITPSKSDGWQEDFIIEYPITDDRFVLGDGLKKSKQIKADYVLRYNSIILSLVGKTEGEILEEHLSQLQNYAKKLDVLISCFSNDKEILCYDRT